MNKFTTLLFLSAFALFAGCNRPTVSTLPYEQMADRDFVAVVNGVGYTKGELERDVAITEKLLMVAGIAPEHMVSRTDPLSFRRSVISGFVAREVLLGEADRRRIELTAADMADFQERFAGGLSARLPLGFDALLDALGKDATVFRNNLKKDALSAKMETALKNQIAATLPPPTSSALAKAKQDVLDANRQVEADNKTLSRLATNAWRSIRAGNDFAVVAQKLPSLHKGITFESDYRDTAGRFRSMPCGTLTAPVAADGGLEIAQVSATAEGATRISRLFFKSTKTKPLPSTKALVDAQKAKALNARYAALLKELKTSAEISKVEL